MSPDAYWEKVGKDAEQFRTQAAVREASIKRGWLQASAVMAAFSAKKYASRIRSDGKVLCMKCHLYRPPSCFWIIRGGTYLNRCKDCSHERHER
jgi:hypothetical protein